MAHVVGVPKRDPCRKCQLPVFLAERLMVGKKVYHRTCLKCARCGYQLTPGSFYETEVDDQYCCETCPDEEVTETSSELAEGGIHPETDSSNVELRNKFESTSTVLPSTTKSVRSSIKERLAFFEQQRDDDTDSKLLQKSLSDEEKSKSLQRLESSAPAVGTTYKINPALSSFLNDTVDNEPVLEEDHSEGSSSIHNSKMETSDSEDEETDDLTSVSLPPELPKSLPPSEEPTIEVKPVDTTKRFTASAELVLGSANQNETEARIIKADEQQNIVLETTTEKQKSELQINLSSSETNDKTNNNINNKETTISSPPMENIEEHQTQETVQLQEIKLENNLVCSETNDNDCVTKDKATVEVPIETETKVAQQLKSTNATEDITRSRESLTKLSETIQEKGEPTNEVKIVKDNVQIRTKSEEEIKTSNSNLEDSETTERLSVVRARLQQFEVITNNEKEDLVKASTPKPSNSNDEDISKSAVNDTPKYIDNEPVTIEQSSSLPSRLDENTIQENQLETESLKINKTEQDVPLTLETKDNEILENKLAANDKQSEQKEVIMEENSTPQKKTPSKIAVEEYPEDLNPFKSDEEDEEIVDDNKENVELRKPRESIKNDNSNPFDSSDDEVELEKSQNSRTSISSTPKVPPPRPPPPRISRNPFGSEDEDDTVSQNFSRGTNLTASQTKRTPVPTPRSNISQSQNPTPEPTPRLSTKLNSSTNSSSITATPHNSSSYILQNSSDFYGSANSLHSSNTTPHHLLRNSDVRSSNNSLNLSAGGTIRSRKSRRAPLPPAPVKELFPSNETINSSSKTSTPSSSTVGTPKSGRKKRLAPAPPKPARLEPSQVPQIQVDTIETQPKNLNSYPLQSELDSKLSDEEKALLEGKTLHSLQSNESDLALSPASRRNSKRLIPLDKELLEEHGSPPSFLEHSSSQCDDLKQQNQLKSTAQEEVDEANVVYRRVLIPHNLETPTHERNPLIDDLNHSSSVGERQLEKLKDNKEANNRNRQSQISAASSGAEDNDPLFNKSAHGKWKRRKGPAPALPIPPRKVLQMLPLQEIKHELEIIEVQQQGLEKQGVILEKMIRDRCEGENGEPLKANGMPEDLEQSAGGLPSGENSKEVEYLILQLFELVNEKNELFRRQAELMYLRRQHRLEQEQADLEYEIRILMAQPERNKTDSDKAREEALIERLVEVVQLRNEVVECLEMDRIREAEEDHSIKQHLESHIAKREDEADTKKSATKLSKKEKKKQKEAKKLSKSKKLDADKDADESELNADKQKTKKKKKIFIF